MFVASRERIEIKGADVLSLPLFVAPFAGAWIEIRDMLQCDNIYECVASSRERGLKSLEMEVTWYDLGVAPFAGAWIEILRFPVRNGKRRRPSRERGLK